jgi:2-dehydropantoate 2-reductase
MLKVAILGTGSVARVIGSLIDSNSLLFIGRHLGSEYVFQNGNSKRIIKGYQSSESINPSQENVQETIWCGSSANLQQDFSKFIKPEAYEGRILVLMNGMGYEKCFEEAFPKAQINYGIIKFGAWKEKNSVHLISPPLIRISESTTTLLRNSIIDIENSSDIQKDRLQKLSINCIINPITATLNIKNGDLMHNNTAKVWVIAIIEETIDFWKLQKVYHSANDYEKAILKTAEFTSENNSSMLSARINKQEMETKYILGTVIRLTNSKSLVKLLKKLSQLP